MLHSFLIQKVPSNQKAFLKINQISRVQIRPNFRNKRGEKCRNKGPRYHKPRGNLLFLRLTFRRAIYVVVVDIYMIEEASLIQIQCHTQKHHKNTSERARIEINHTEENHRAT